MATNLTMTPSLAMIPSGVRVAKLYSILPSNGVGDFTHFRNSFATRVNADGLIEEMDFDVPRLDYPIINGVVQTCPELLLEPQSTNLAIRSEEFETGAWTVFESGTSTLTITADFCVSPDGTETADRFSVVDNGGDVLLTHNVTVLNATKYNLSVYMKGEVGGEEVSIRFKNGAGFGVNGIVRTLTTEWVRYDETFESIGTNQGFQFKIATGHRQIQDFCAWGTQLEELEYATSYIKTTTSAGVRLTETLKNGGDSDTFNSLEGVLFLEVATLFDDLTRRSISINDGGMNNRVMFQFDAFSNRLLFLVAVGGSNIFAGNITLSDETLFNKIALKWKENDFALWVNGVEEVMQSSGVTFPVGVLNKVKFDNGTDANLFGRTRVLKVFDKALTDVELENLTK